MLENVLMSGIIKFPHQRIKTYSIPSKFWQLGWCEEAIKWSVLPYRTTQTTQVIGKLYKSTFTHPQSRTKLLRHSASLVRMQHFSCANYLLYLPLRSPFQSMLPGLQCGLYYIVYIVTPYCNIGQGAWGGGGGGWTCARDSGVVSKVNKVQSSISQVLSEIACSYTLIQNTKESQSIHTHVQVHLSPNMKPKFATVQLKILSYHYSHFFQLV